MKTELTLSEKTTTMEKAIKMAKDIHSPSNINIGRAMQFNEPMNERAPSPVVLETAKTIYDWIING